MPGFLNSLADKAQSALNSTPLAGHLPSGNRPNSPDSSAQPSANQAAAQGSKNHTLEALHHQLRAFGQQYGSTSPVQKIITTEKGVAIDFDSLSRDAKAQSKELYTWGQSEDDDLKDVTDRLAYLNFVQGSLASSLAVKLDAARAPLKTLRDAETALAPRRATRAGFTNQIARLEHDQKAGNEKKIADFRDQLKKAEAEDAPQEREIELLKRKAVRESEQLKWEAIREYGEKLVLLAQASSPIIQALPTLPPSADSPYAGAQATGAARASLQRALDNYKTGHINLPPHSAGADLGRSDTRSFGESHAKELSSISSDAAESFRPGIPLTPPTSSKPLGPPSASATKPSNTGSISNPSVTKSSTSLSSPPPVSAPQLNQAPTPLPAHHSSSAVDSPVPVAAIATDAPQQQVMPTHPTVAETGIPLSASQSGGPGPASGSLKDLHSPSSSAAATTSGASVAPKPTAVTSSSAGKWESAEEEKKRLAQGYSRAYNEDAQPRHETAEEEKKRLEREERERVLRGAAEQPKDPKKDEELPPYQDI